MSIAMQPAVLDETPKSYTVPKQSMHQLHHLLKRVQQSVTPVWPLKDYVAVNPYASLGDMEFMEARAHLRSFSGCEMLPSLSVLAEEYRQGRIDLSCLKVAAEQSNWQSHYESVQHALCSINEVLESSGDSPSPNTDASPRKVQPLSESLQQWTKRGWVEPLKHELGKFCASYFDEGQAAWKNPSASSSLYSAWLQNAEHDLNPEILGIRGFRRFVSRLSPQADVAIAQLLQVLRVPSWLWEKFLLAHVYSLPGWFAYARYQAEENSAESRFSNAFIDLLAVRLSYEAALGECFRFSVDWESYRNDVASDREQGEYDESDAMVFERSVLLRASELTYETKLLSQLPAHGERQGQQSSVQKPGSSRKLAQMVFCIDVRSERFRRQLESCHADVETFGFAGFFGAPIEIVPLGETASQNQLPVLLQPQFQVQLGLPSQIDDQEIIGRRQTTRRLRDLWKKFTTAATSCFSFVESSGLAFAPLLLGRTFGKGSRSPDHGALDGLSASQEPLMGPTLRGLNSQGITTSRQAELAATILRNLGLTDGFARLVVLCGHESQSENNPLAASLDCGACGGHSGEPNARFVAKLLNQNYVRQALADQGIKIPDDTHFQAATHNTTTDEIQFLDISDLPATHEGDLQELQDASASAAELNRLERAAQLPASSPAEVFRRSVEWSEIRPEWGLAGNAAFIAAPRSLTANLDLEGRAFLHSYEHSRDSDGSVLELIMTAPMVVAHWINMQYFASSVDPEHFGSGSKTLHNVVGRFGLLSGEGGDLTTGLPWESVHDGQHLHHKPLRLLCVIAAPRDAIDRVLGKHEFLADLVANHWLNLVCIENGSEFRCERAGVWTGLDPESDSSEEPDFETKEGEASPLRIYPDTLRT